LDNKVEDLKVENLNDNYVLSIANEGTNR